MKDEEYVFRSDVREKASVSRSARYRRTHNGKRGRVKLPSDYMTEKEKKQMNGEVKSYRLNEPMSWKEFKALPDDIRVIYVKLLREKFHCFDSAIAEMMGVNKCSFSQEIKRLGLGHGTKHGGNRTWAEKDAFYAWVNGAPVPTTTEEADAAANEIPAESGEVIVPYIPAPEALPVRQEKRKAIPKSGTMTFDGGVEEVVDAILGLLGDACVHINISWEVMQERSGETGGN